MINHDYDEQIHEKQESYVVYTHTHPTLTVLFKYPKYFKFEWNEDQATILIKQKK